ncbi:MAG: MFS transporter [Planctomycetes bacterium]|nr:MFS transporter [Planctomycetota bacterium]
MSNPSPSALGATRVRYSILGMLCLLAMITYLDRAVNGNAQDDMMKAVGRPVEDFYIVLIAFQLAYALFEIPTGWMGDKYGPRSTLLRIVLWWSLFIGLTGFAGMYIPAFGAVLIGFTVLVVLQFFFGMGEAGAFPNITKSLYHWFPAAQRGTAQGAIWLSARFMGGLTPMIWVILTELLGFKWNEVLWLFAGIAGLWCIMFYFWFTNSPEEHSWTNQQERELINAGQTAESHSGVPWGKLLRSRNLLFVCLMYMVTNFNWYFLMYYMPKALRSQFPGMRETDGGKVLLGLISGTPLLIGMVGCMLGGLLTDRYVRRTGDRKWGRRIFAMIGYGMAGVCYLMSSFLLGNFWAFAICIMLVGFFNDLIMGSAWATCQDIGRRYAAIVSGCMNMVGNLGAALGLFVTGRILKYYKGIGDETAGLVTLFTLYAIIYGVGVLLWLKIDASKPIDPDSH